MTIVKRLLTLVLAIPFFMGISLVIVLSPILWIVSGKTLDDQLVRYLDLGEEWLDKIEGN